MDVTNNIHVVIKIMLKCNVQMEELLTAHKSKNKLPLEAANQFTAAAFSMGVCVAAAAQHYLLHQYKIFGITAKLHMILHCALHSRYINPRLVWCFMGEDMMKHYSTLAQSCVKGNRGPMAARKCIAKLRLAMHITYQKMCDE